MKASQVNRFVGIPYEADRFDCADLAALVQKELFGKAVVLPGHHPKGAATQAAAIRKGADVLAERIAKEEAMPGDAVLIVSEGLLHIGTMLELSSIAWVLHASATLGHSVLHRLADLPAYGLKIEGYYRWK